MSNVNRLIVISSLAPQYFDDATGTLINITNGFSTFGTFIFIPSLGIAYSKNATQYSTSTDGITWTNRVATLFVYTLIYKGTRFITFGSGGCMYSTDGITWVNDTVQTANIRAAIYCDTLGCVLAQIQGLNRNIIRSYDSVAKFFRR